MIKEAMPKQKYILIICLDAQRLSQQCPPGPVLLVWRHTFVFAALHEADLFALGYSPACRKAALFVLNRFTSEVHGY
jgi:hypothetical protein